MSSPPESRRYEGNTVTAESSAVTAPGSNEHFRLSSYPIPVIDPSLVNFVYRMFEDPNPDQLARYLLAISIRAVEYRTVTFVLTIT